MNVTEPVVPVVDRFGGRLSVTAAEAMDALAATQPVFRDGRRHVVSFRIDGDVISVTYAKDPHLLVDADFDTGEWPKVVVDHVDRGDARRLLARFGLPASTVRCEYEPDAFVLAVVPRAFDRHDLVAFEWAPGR